MVVNGLWICSTCLMSIPRLILAWSYSWPTKMFNISLLFYPDILQYYTMILQRSRIYIVVRVAGFDPGKSVSYISLVPYTVYSTFKPPHLLECAMQWPHFCAQLTKTCSWLVYDIFFLLHTWHIYFLLDPQLVNNMVYSRGSRLISNLLIYV